MSTNSELDFNTIENCFKSFGVDLKDSTGQFKSLKQLFIELSEKWEDYNEI